MTGSVLDDEAQREAEVAGTFRNHGMGFKLRTGGSKNRRIGSNQSKV